MKCKLSRAKHFHPTVPIVKMNATTVAAKFTTEVSGNADWISNLLILLGASGAVLVVGLPLSSVSFVGALKASINKEATVIDWVIVYFNFGIIQTCLIGGGATVAQLAGHLLERGNVHIPCIIAHCSKAYGSTVIHIGLTTIAILRFIYVLYPNLGLRINAHQRWWKVGIPAFLTCIALVQNLVDYVYNKDSRYGFCLATAKNSLRAMVATSTITGAMGFIFAVIVGDLLLTVAIVNNIRKRNIQVSDAIGEVCPRQSQHNLLTIRGTLLCRAIATVGYLAFFLVRPILSNDKDPLSDQFYIVLIQTFITACNTVLLPLVCILQSFYIRQICQNCCPVQEN